MNFEKKPIMGRGVRRAAFGTTLAMAAAGALAAPAFAAEGISVTGSPQSGVAFTAKASDVASGTGYRIVLAASNESGDLTNVAEAGTCWSAPMVAADATLSCTLTENTPGVYYVKLLSADGGTILATAPVTVGTTTGAVTPPTATDGAGTNDKLILTKTAGVIWKVDGAAVDFGSATTKDIDVSTGAAVVTLEAASGYVLPANQRTSWAYRFSTTDSALTAATPPVEGAATAPTYVDKPGSTQDTVTVTKTAGVDWYVNGTKVSFTGDATTATVYSTVGTKTTVEARAADGYVFPGNLAVHWYTPTLKGEYVEPATLRLAGENRMDTAVEISKKYWTSAETVYVANGLRYADALTAGPAATKDGGPLLLAMQNSVPDNVLDEIQRLKPARIHVVGGTSVVSAGVESTLNAIAPVTRLAGESRYETAAAVSSRWADSASWAPGNPVVYLAVGENFPDALSGGSGAAIEKGALMLSSKTALTEPTSDAIKRLKPSKVLLVGGTNVLSEAVRLQVKDLVPATTQVERYAGADRYATSAVVATKSGSADVTDKALFLATGLNFPDALAGVPAASKLGAPLFLSQPTCLPPSVKTVVNTMTALETQVRLGSDGVLGNFSLAKVCSS